MCASFVSECAVEFDLALADAQTPWDPNSFFPALLAAGGAVLHQPDPDEQPGGG